MYGMYDNSFEHHLSPTPTLLALLFLNVVAIFVINKNITDTRAYIALGRRRIIKTSVTMLDGTRRLNDIINSRECDHVGWHDSTS